MRNYLLLLVALAVACVANDGADLQPAPAIVQARSVPIAPAPAPALEVHASVMLAPAAVAVAVAKSDYEDAENWCYEVDDLPLCRREKDTSAHPDLPVKCPADPRTGRRRICVDPWWVAGHERVCVPQPLTKKERQVARDELKAIIYRRENGRHAGVCKPQAWWRWGQGHAVEDGFCHPERLERYMRLVHWRETRLDHRKTHLLNPDQKAAAGAWSRKRELYSEVNDHYWQGYRWRSRGAYGQNPALHLWRWDRTAPPEVLCNRVIATETYLTTMRGCHQKLKGLRGHDPDWWDLHHCASGGKFDRPEIVPEKKGSFVDRARSKRIKLDPFERVPYEWLGKTFDHDLSTVRAIEAKIASVLG